jgi:hypothetical protein
MAKKYVDENKKFKDFRSSIEMGTLTVIMVIVSFILGFSGSYGMMMIGFIIAAVCMFAVFMSYNNEVGKSEIIYYRWYAVLMWTDTIGYNAIQRIEAVSKHKVEITPKDKNEKRIKIYVFDSDAFVAAAKKARGDYVTTGRKGRRAVKRKK